MLMLGKMSVGVRRITSGPERRMRSATTAKVYGRRRASRTIHIACRVLRPPAPRRGFRLSAKTALFPPEFPGPARRAARKRDRGTGRKSVPLRNMSGAEESIPGPGTRRKKTAGVSPGPRHRYVGGRAPDSLFLRLRCGLD